MDVTIKRLRPDDWPYWKALRLDALADAPHAFGSRLADWIDAPDDRWRARIIDVPFNVIALHCDTPVGQVSAMHDQQSTSPELIGMWVSPAARGIGVGDALIAAAVSWATDQQASAIELSVTTSNLAARRLYVRNGFVFTGARSGDEVRMMRTLPP